MSFTGLDLRTRLRRRVVQVLDAIILRLDEAPPAPEAEPPAVTPEPAEPAPEPVATPTAPNRAEEAAAATPTPLPDLPKTRPPLQDAKKPAAKKPAAKKPASGAGTTAAGKKAKESAEDRQAKHLARTRRGLLSFVHEQGGQATLRALHEHSESTYFVAHVGFSRMMEELTGDGLLDYDHDTATATLTDAGRAELI